MKSKILLVAAALAGLTAIPAFGAEPLPPAGTYRAEILGLPPTPPEIEKLMHTMMLAVASDPDWIITYRQQHPLKPGERLPYNEKFGISAADYARMVQAASHVTLAKVGEAVVTVAAQDGTTTIALQGTSLPVAEFEFEADGKIRCAKGAADSSKPIDESRASAQMGTWQGSEWTIQPEDADSGEPDGTAIKVDLGLDSTHHRLMGIQILHKPEQTELDQSVLVRWAGK
jgi:hypothetical protein